MYLSPSLIKGVIYGRIISFSRESVNRTGHDADGADGERDMDPKRELRNRGGFRRILTGKLFHCFPGGRRSVRTQIEIRRAIQGTVKIDFQCIVSGRDPAEILLCRIQEIAETVVSINPDEPFLFYSKKNCSFL